MPRVKMDKVQGIATTVVETKHNSGSLIVVSYHQTAVVMITPRNIRLNTGGWHTYTTKLRMNQASNQFGLGYKVFQRRGDWYVKYGGKVKPFEDDEILLRR